jgi:hypothetical protein
MQELAIIVKLLMLKTIVNTTVQKMFFLLVGGGILMLRRGANKKEAFIIVLAAVTVGLGLGYILEAVIRVVLPAVDISSVSPIVYVLAGILSYDTVLHMVDKSPRIVDGASIKIEDALRKKKL